ETRRMAHHRNADRFAVDGARVIHPRGRNAPCLAVFKSLVVYDAAALLRIDPHRVVYADRKRALLRIAEYDVSFGGLDRDCKINPAIAVLALAEAKRPLVFEQLFVAVHPVVAGDDRRHLAVAVCFDKLAMHGARAAVGLVVVAVGRPEIDSAYLVVVEPERL